MFLFTSFYNGDGEYLSIYDLNYLLLDSLNNTLIMNTALLNPAVHWATQSVGGLSTWCCVWMEGKFDGADRIFDFLFA